MRIGHKRVVLFIGTRHKRVVLVSTHLSTQLSTQMGTRFQLISLLPPLNPLQQGIRVPELGVSKCLQGVYRHACRGFRVHKRESIIFVTSTSVHL